MAKSLSILAYLAMVAGLVGLAVTRNLFSPSPIVILIQAAAILLLVWARVTFGRRSFHLAANPTAGGLVTTGPYRLIRHPIYTAICLFVLAGVLSHWSWAAVAGGGLVLGASLLRMFYEEALVAQRYPEYRGYAATTWRMIPLIF